MTFTECNRAIGKRPNVRLEIARVKRDPMQSFFVHIGEEINPFVSSDISRYCDAYQMYFLSVRRFMTSMSIVTRYMNGAHYKRKFGGKYSSYEKAIADKYREVAPYTEFDIANCLLHARILLDRVASISRRFLRGGQLPSFTSFSDHKKFFQRLQGPYGLHEPYAQYLREYTPWFEMPLKEVRDKFVVHSAPKHSRFVGLPNNWEVELVILRAEGKPPEKPFSKSSPVIVNVLRMSHDIEIFLNWFCAYAINATSKS